MSKPDFLLREAGACREAAEQARAPSESRALLQLARHYEREARLEQRSVAEAGGDRGRALGR